MRLAYIAVVVAIVLVTGLTRAAALPGQQPGPNAAVKKVRIVVAQPGVHLEQCKGGKYQPVDILVDANPKNNIPSHCVKGTVVTHGKAHEDQSTIVMLSYKAKESVLWYADSEFQITSITPHDDKNAATAPKNPFQKPFPDKPTKAVESGPILQAAIDHRYKITFTINGRTIDPDLWCNP